MLNLGIDVIDTSDSTEELLYARSAVVLGARVANCRPPLDGPFIDISKTEQFSAQCAQARMMGFKGKMLIHPSQVELTHQGFRPGEAETAQARRVVEAFREAEAQGIAAIGVDGRLVDYPVASRAQRILEAAEL
jgi:citrate lyase subunit beta/citryl-CoA lyase